MFHFRMAVMTEWCNRVAGGRMPHGALLAHTRLTGQEVRQAKGYSLPAQGVDWQQHGREGTAAVRAILLAMGFYPQMAESVRDRPPPALVPLSFGVLPFPLRRVATTQPRGSAFHPIRNGSDGTRIPSNR